MSYQIGESYGLSREYQLSEEPAAPVHGSAASSTKPRTPTVWYGYQFYCFLMTLIYMIGTIGGALVALNASEFTQSSSTNLQGLSPQQIQVYCWIVSISSFAFGAMHAIGAFSKSGTSGWVLGIVVLGFGLTSLCTAPFAIFMMIGWFKQTTRHFFSPVSMEEQMRQEAMRSAY